MTACSKWISKFLASSLIFGVAATSVMAQETGSSALNKFVQSVHSGQADFSQTVLDKAGKPKTTSTGSFSFVRPNQFRFNYAKPYKQEIVSDGKTLSFFDVDLNQVTQRSAKEALATTPVAVLAGGDLSKAFALSDLPERDAQQWVQATPKTEGGSVKALRLGFKAGHLASLEIDDALGQQSVLVFGNFKANAVVPANTFNFKAPAGVEVLKQ